MMSTQFIFRDIIRSEKNLYDMTLLTIFLFNKIPTPAREREPPERYRTCPFWRVSTPLPLIQVSVSPSISSLYFSKSSTIEHFFEFRLQRTNIERPHATVGSLAFISTENSPCYSILTITVHLRWPLF